MGEECYDFQYIFDMYAEEILEEKDVEYKEKKIRLRSSKCKLMETTWMRLIHNPNTYDPSSYEGKLFRRRFRVPFDLFKDKLVPMCTKANIFEMKKTPAKNIENQDISVFTDSWKRYSNG